MATIDSLLDDLTKEIAALKDHFLKRWLPAAPEHGPDDFQHDVKAYCVLTHAAFEEFAENLSTLAAKEAQAAWLAKKYHSGAFALLSAYSFKLNIVAEETQDQDRYFDQFRFGLEDCIRRHSDALHNNHGFSLKYLRSILTPVGIDVPTNPALMESLRDLAEARGSYAHTTAKLGLYGRRASAKRPMSPEDAKAAVDDCVQLCNELANRFRSATPPP